MSSFKFQTIEEINNYRLMTITSQAKFFADFIKHVYKAINKDMIYTYNAKSKLWQEIVKNQFNCFVYEFYNSNINDITDIMNKEQTNDETRKNLLALKKLFDTKNYLNDIIDRCFPHLYDTQFITKLNAKPDFLPIKGGKKINLKTLEIKKRKSTDYFTYECPVEYVEKTPNADKFFKQIQPKEDNRELLRKILGYELTGDTKARKFFIWYGFGSNGKSKVFKVVEKIMGCQYSQVDKSIFMKSKKSSGGATPEIMDLMGKRTGVYSEGDTADNIEMNIAGIKGISGEDKISGRPLYCSKVDFYPYIKINLLTNFTPSLEAQKSIVDRLVYIFMDTNFTDKPKEKNDIKIDNDFATKIENEYLSEMFSWMVKGAKEYYKDYKIEMTPEFKERTEYILKTEDSIKAYLDRRLIFTKNSKDTIRVNELFEDYKKFSTDNRLRCQPGSSVKNRLEQNGVQVSTLHGYNVYRGIKYNEEDKQEQENPLDNGVIDQKEEIKDNQKDKIISNLENQIEELKRKLQEYEKIKINKSIKPKEEIPPEIAKHNDEDINYMLDVLE